MASKAKSAVRWIRVDAIRIRPENQPRARLNGAGIASLAESIAAVGMLQPIVVRTAQDGSIDLMAGHRRLAAARRLKWSEVPANFIDADEDVARAIGLVENLQREELDPIDEAQAFARELEKGQGPAEVARIMGTSPQHVARRANIARLPKGVVAKLRKLDRLPPAETLVRLALLAPSQLEQLSKRLQWGEAPGAKWLERELDLEERRIRKAKWDPADEELLPRAGSCTACPHNSANSPDLFEAQEDEKGAGSCREPSCWTKKLQAWVHAQLAAARAEHGDDLLLLQGDYTPGPHLAEPKGSVWFGDYKRAKKGAAGARVGFVVSGRGAGTLRHVRVTARSGGRLAGGGSAATDRSAEKARREKLRASNPKKWAAEELKRGRARLAARRAALSIEGIEKAIRALELDLEAPEVLERLDPATKSAEGALLRLGACYGLSSRLVARGKKAPATSRVLARAWTSIRMRVLESFRGQRAPFLREARWIGTLLLGPATVAALERESVEAIAEPKRFAQLRTMAAAKPKARPRARARKA